MVMYKHVCPNLKKNFRKFSKTFNAPIDLELVFFFFLIFVSFCFPSIPCQLYTMFSYGYKMIYLCALNLLGPDVLGWLPLNESDMITILLANQLY